METNPQFLRKGLIMARQYGVHPLSGYGDMFSDLLQAGAGAARSGATAAAASALQSAMANPELQAAAMNQAQSAAATGLAQQLLAQKAALTASVAQNKALYIGGAIAVAGLAFYWMKRK